MTKEQAAIILDSLENQVSGFFSVDVGIGKTKAATQAAKKFRIRKPVTVVPGNKKAKKSRIPRKLKKKLSSLGIGRIATPKPEMIRKLLSRYTESNKRRKK